MGVGVVRILESVVVPFTEQKTPHLHYKDQPVNVVQGNNRCLFSDRHKTHKHCVVQVNIV